ncbi:MAG: hypothetical protein ACPHID_00430 [Thermoplasmatota archaeon]
MRAHALNGLLALVALTGAWRWIAPDGGAHLAAGIAFVLVILWHAVRADRSVKRTGGVFATVAVLAVAAVGFGHGDFLVLAHVAAALIMVGAGVMMHVRALGRVGDFIDALAVGLVVWLALHIARLF